VGGVSNVCSSPTGGAVSVVAADLPRPITAACARPAIIIRGQSRPLASQSLEHEGAARKNRLAWFQIPPRAKSPHRPRLRSGNTVFSPPARAPNSSKRSARGQSGTVRAPRPNIHRLPSLRTPWAPRRDRSSAPRTTRSPRPPLFVILDPARPQVLDRHPACEPQFRPSNLRASGPWAPVLAEE